MAGFEFLLSVAALILLFKRNAESQYIIKNLPGFDGDLPFKLETGYISIPVGKNSEAEMFYYFIESEGNPNRDPLVLSLTGGPGCSAFSSLAFEYGPITFNSSTFRESLPSLVLNPYSWTKIANIIFLDWPVGAGFSYATTPDGYGTSDSASATEISGFLRKWLLKHPGYVENDLYILGQSYAGKIAPMVAWEISEANERGILPKMPLRGYFIGDPATHPHEAINDRYSYAHRMGLIPDDYLEKAEKSCNGEFENPDKTNVPCQAATNVITECLAGIDYDQILEPACPKVDRTASDDQFTNLISSRSKPPCRNIYRTISESWANNLCVRNALGVREETKGNWRRCNLSVPLYKDVVSSAKHNLLLIEKGYHGLVYNGDHDLRVPYFSTLKWIYSLNLSLDDSWRPWRVDQRVAGFTMRHRGKTGSYLTFATIKGSGHTPAEYTPLECFVMISRWLSGNPL